MVKFENSHFVSSYFVTVMAYISHQTVMPLFTKKSLKCLMKQVSLLKRCLLMSLTIQQSMENNPRRPSSYNAQLPNRIFYPQYIDVKTAKRVLSPRPHQAQEW